MQVFSSVMQKFLDISECAFCVETKLEDKIHRKFPDSGSPYYYQVIARFVKSGIEVVLRTFPSCEDACSYCETLLDDLDEEAQTGMGSVLFPDQPGGDPGDE